MIIAIDGPAGTGKTTVAKRVAERLRFAYFDTGAVYRAVTWVVLKKKIDLKDEASLKEILESLLFRIEERVDGRRYFIGTVDVSEEIRSPEVTAHVSAVAALPIVRKSLLKIQRDVATRGNIVFEGRDIGSVVFPNAELKIFLTARPEVRARRRLDELLAKNPEMKKTLSPETMLQEITRRDQLDSTRELAPLICPKDAHIIDTSYLTIDEVIEQIIQYKQKLHGKHSS